MTDDLSHADLVQIAQATAAGGQVDEATAAEDCPEEGADEEAPEGCVVAGAGGDGLDAVPVLSLASDPLREGPALLLITTGQNDIASRIAL